MNTKWIKVGIVVFIVIIVFSIPTCKYNSLVQLDEAVQSQWSQVENVYQRRADLIPNLVNTVKGVANFEKSTLESVIKARASATSIKVDASTLSPDQIRKFQSAQGELSQALGRLMMITENYPQLKANQNFLQLQAQLEGTENRIAVERRKFNETTKMYNTAIRTFPGNIAAHLFEFDKKGYFEATQGAEKAPTVDFGN